MLSAVELRFHPEGSVIKMNENATPDIDLLYEVRDGVGRIIFNRPQARNSLTFGMHERLAARCEAAVSDRTLKPLILRRRRQGLRVLHRPQSPTRVQHA